MSRWPMITQDIFRILSTDKPPKARKRQNLNVRHENLCRTRHTGILRSSNNNNFRNRESVEAADFQINEDAEATEAVSEVQAGIMSGPGCPEEPGAVEDEVRGSIMGLITVWAVR